MLLKLIGCVLTAAAGLAVGCLKTQKLSARRDFYEKFCVFLSLTETQIRYVGGDVFSLVSRCAVSSGLNFLCVGEDSDLSFSDIWNGRIAAAPSKNGLNNSDKELLCEFGSALGATDIEGQLKHIALYQSIFLEKLSESKAAVKEKSRIYRSLGLFAGISAALIIL